MFESLKERLGSGGFREWLENNQSIVTIGAVVLLAIAVFVMIRSMGTPDIDTRLRPMQYFYDVETEEGFEADPDLLPPIIRENGNEAVRVHFYTCGDCSGIDAGEMFVAYYEKYSVEDKARWDAFIGATGEGTRVPDVVPDGFHPTPLISRDAKRWVEFFTPAGHAIYDNPGRCDPDDKLEFPEACGPDDVDEFLDPSDE